MRGRLRLRHQGAFYMSRPVWMRRELKVVAFRELFERQLFVTIDHSNRVAASVEEGKRTRLPETSLYQGNLIDIKTHQGRTHGIKSNEIVTGHEHSWSDRVTRDRPITLTSDDSIHQTEVAPLNRISDIPLLVGVEHCTVDVQQGSPQSIVAEPHPFVDIVLKRFDVSGGPDYPVKTAINTFDCNERTLLDPVTNPSMKPLPDRRIWVLIATLFGRTQHEVWEGVLEGRQSHVILKSHGDPGSAVGLKFWNTDDRVTLQNRIRKEVVMVPRSVVRLHKLVTCYVDP